MISSEITVSSEELFRCAEEWGLVAIGLNDFIENRLQEGVRDVFEVPSQQIITFIYAGKCDVCCIGIGLARQRTYWLH